LLHLARQRVVEPQRLGNGFRGEQRRGQIPLAAVRQQSHHGALAQRAGFVQRHFHGRPGAHPHKDALFAGQASSHLVSRIVIHVDDRCRLVRTENPGRIALLHVLQALELVPLERLDPDHADGRIAFLQHPRGAHQRTGRAHRDHDHVHPAVGRLPDLPARAFVVSQPIGVVIELVHQEVLVRLFPGQPIRFLNGPVGALIARGEQDLGSVGFQDPLPLFARRFAHRHQQPIALDRTDHRQADGRIAAAGLQHDLVRRQQALRLGLFDHHQPDAVLDRASRIHRFQLDQQFHARHRVHPVDPYQWGMANQFENTLHFLRCHHIRSSHG